MNTPEPCGDSPLQVEQHLLQITRNERLYPVLRALLQQEISRLVFDGSARYFTYPVSGDEVVATDEDLAAVCVAIAKSIGRRTVRAVPKRLRGLEAQETLVLPTPVKQALLMELLAIAANLTASDLERLPEPIEVRQANTIT